MQQKENDRMDETSRKKIEQAQYRAKLVEAELAAVKGSKAYRMAQLLGIVRAQIKSDPVGLSKKVARKLLEDPKNLMRLGRRVQNGSIIAQNVAEQNNKYQEWILLNEPDEAELEAQRLASEAFSFKPVISIVTPVFNPPAKVFEELIESVLEQSYPHFELCLGNFGDDEEIKVLIKKYAALDKRIRDWPFAENKGIAYNSNLILKKVSGDYIALLDHDDTLSPDALYENVKLLNEKRYDFIYSDKDKIDEQNNRFDPLFKPKWSPEMLLNVNYLTHLNVMRTDLVREIGGWDTDTDGAQDWDLFLRVARQSEKIAHIPKVLYHWRVIASSTALSIDTKPYALAGQRRAIDKYLEEKKIPATSYHQHTELMLRWAPDAINQNPLVFVEYSNTTNAARLMRNVRKVVSDPQFVIVCRQDVVGINVTTIAKQLQSDYVTYDADGFGTALAKFLKAHKTAKGQTTAIFLRDTIRVPQKNAWYEHMAGWLSIDEVAAVGGRLVDRRDIIVNSGGIIGQDGQYRPIFSGYPRYYQSYIGNAEWVRNLTVLSPWFFATDLAQLKAFSFERHTTDSDAFDNYFFELASRQRLVMNPHATASVYEEAQAMDLERPVAAARRLNKQGKPFIDEFGNVNLSPTDPLRLFADEPLIGIDNPAPADSPTVNEYQHDAVILAGSFDISAEQMAANTKPADRNRNGSPRSVAWILPSFDAIYAGLVNIFSFASYLADEQGLRTTIYILKAGNDVSHERDAVLRMFPALKDAAFVALLPDNAKAIKPHDIGIATQWATAFPLAKSEVITKKCYFIQDNEANFYPKGTISALVELSYRFGFTAIAGTEGLLRMYKDTYGGKGVALKSKVDLSAYHPRQDKYYTPHKPYKVFFYARPNMPRNAFELGIAGLKSLKLELGADVEVITAGAPWDPAAYGVEGLFTNLGKIEYEAVPKLYRSVDAGLMFMFSGHPGVTASELMASGCPVVVNEYDDVTWHELYQHEKTCLITLATASEVARNLKRCLTDTKLRKQLIDGGLEKTTSFYTGYEASLKSTYEYLRK